jgi:hypothetical protein
MFYQQPSTLFVLQHRLAARRNYRIVNQMIRRVLIIDDAQDIRSLLECALKREKCAVITVGSRDDALSIIDDWKPDLILLDYYMPGLSIDIFLKKLIEENTADNGQPKPQSCVHQSRVCGLLDCSTVWYSL